MEQANPAATANVWIARSTLRNFEMSRLPFWGYNEKNNNWKGFEGKAKKGDLIAFVEDGVVVGFVRYTGEFGEKNPAHTNEAMGWTGYNYFTREIRYEARVSPVNVIPVAKVGQICIWEAKDEEIAMVRREYMNALVEKVAAMQSIWAEL